MAEKTKTKYINNQETEFSEYEKPRNIIFFASFVAIGISSIVSSFV